MTHLLVFWLFVIALVTGAYLVLGLMMVTIWIVVVDLYTYFKGGRLRRWRSGVGIRFPTKAPPSSYLW